ncbi:MAG: hypothetical protein ABR610_18240, partial [Thermoanaerobaculia bacterium]
LEASGKFSRTVYGLTNDAARMINQLEWTRKQLEDQRKMLAAAKAEPSVSASVEELERRVRAVQDRLMQPTLAEADLKSFRGAMGLYLKLLWLQAESGTGGGDVSGNADMGPTGAESEVFELLSGQLATTRRDFDELYEKRIPEFNEAMRAKGLAGVMTVKEPLEPRPPRPEEPEDDDDWAAD